MGFTGPRIIKQTMKVELPPGFQESEFLRDHGQIDIVVERKLIRPTLAKLIDYLAPDFYYSENTTSGSITTAEPVVDLQTLNGIDRYELYWAFSPPVSILSGETETLTFRAWATKDVSGTYYNEVIALPDVHAPTIFSQIGVSDEEYYSCYSWNTGTVIVPAYDSRADADGVTIDANMALILGGISITSWQIY